MFERRGAASLTVLALFAVTVLTALVAPGRSSQADTPSTEYRWPVTHVYRCECEHPVWHAAGSRLISQVYAGHIRMRKDGWVEVQAEANKAGQRLRRFVSKINRSKSLRLMGPWPQTVWVERHHEEFGKAVLRMMRWSPFLATTVRSPRACCAPTPERREY